MKPFPQPSWIALALLATATAPAKAREFPLFGGSVQGVWKSQVTVGAGYRALDVTDPQLVGAGADAEFPDPHGAVGVTDDQELNFPHSGDLYSNPMTLTSELTLAHPNTAAGLFVRVRAWYDLALKGNNVPHGNVGNRYTPNSRLSDVGFTGAAAFSGADVYDAFAYKNFKLGDARLLVRLGRQAIDWGEGVFYPGVNALNPYDYAWLNLPGAPVLNGGKLPVNRVYANLGMPHGWTVDGFFNLEWRPSSFPGCGTYGVILDNGINPGCNGGTPAGQADAAFTGTRNYSNGKLYRNGYFPDGETDPTLANRPMTGEPSQWSGWGVSTRKFVESIATELGLYFTKYTNTTFINSGVTGPTPAEYSLNTMYPQEGVRSLAVSASTGFRNLTLSAQLTATRDYPTHYNAPSYIIGTNTGSGPFFFLKDECVMEQCRTYFLMNITQLQSGGTWQFGEKIGIPDATLAVETDMQWNTNLPPVDGPGAIRLGRFGNFGEADWTNDRGYVCNPGPNANGQVNKCHLGGFVSRFAMGYKVRLATSLPRGARLTFVPVFQFGHDLTGYSADQATISGGRMSVLLSLRTILYQNYTIDLAALRFNKARWDPMKDKGQYTVAFGYNF